MKPPLTQTQLRLIEHFSSTRFNGEFWNCVSMRGALRKLLAQVKYLEKEVQKVEGLIFFNGEP